MRAVGNVEHPSIRDAEELLVYFYREKRFRTVNRNKFPTEKCLICLKKFKKTYNTLSSCKFKTDKWSSFKQHIKRAENIYGELLAFPIESKLPDISQYDKIRLYGHTFDFQNKDKFFIFDLNKKKFVKVDRLSLRRNYIVKNTCNYCSCGRTILSSSLLISHLSTLESKYHCYLLIDELGHNDEKNQQRINMMVKDYEAGKLLFDKSKRINNKSDDNQTEDNQTEDNQTEDNQKANTKSIDELMDDLNDDSEDVSIEEVESKLEELDADSNNDKSFLDQNNLNIKQDSQTVIYSTSNENETNDQIVEQLKDEINRHRNELNSLIQKLNNQINSPLQNSLIQEQISLSLAKKTENYGAKQTIQNLSFSKRLNLNKNDLNQLLSKYNIPENLEIDESEICLNLVMKDLNLSNRSNNLEQNFDSFNNFNSLDSLLSITASASTTSTTINKMNTIAQMKRQLAIEASPIHDKIDPKDNSIKRFKETSQHESETMSKEEYRQENSKNSVEHLTKLSTPYRARSCFS